MMQEVIHVVVLTVQLYRLAYISDLLKERYQGRLSSEGQKCAIVALCKDRNAARLWRSCAR